MDDLKVRITWVNDEASLRAAMQRAQQLLGSVAGGTGIGFVGGTPTPATAAAAGAIVAPPPVYNAAPIATGATTTTTGPATTTTTGGPTYGATVTGTPAGGAGAAGRGGHLGGIMGYFGRYMAIRGAGALTFGGINEVVQQQQTLSDLNRRVGESISKYSDFEAQVLRTGIALGATRQQMIEVTNQFASLTGRMGNGQLQGAVRGAFETAKTLGIAPTSVAGYEGTISQYMQGGGTDFNRLRAALELGVANGMRGREDELIKSVEELTALVGQRIPTIDVQGQMQIQAFIAAMNATGIQGLMGARGTQIASTVQGFLTGQGDGAQQALLYREMYKQSGGKLGALGMAYEIEGGIAGQYGPGVLRGILGMGGSRPIEERRAIVGSTLGVSQHQAEALIKAAPNLTDEQLAKFMTQQTQSPELTAQDKNTEALVDVGRAMQELATTILPAWIAGAGVLTGEIRGLAHTMALFNGVMPMLGQIAIVLAQLAAVNSVTGGLSGKMVPGGVIGAAKSGALAIGSGIAGFAIGDWLGTSLMDNIQSDSRSDVKNAITGVGFFDSLRAVMDPNFARDIYRQRNPPKMARGGIVTAPGMYNLGEQGPEAVVPLSGGASIGQMAQRLNALIGGSGDSWRAFAAQISVETGNGSQMYGNNPFNLRPISGGWPGQVGISPGGFAMFSSLDAGVAAAASNYRAGNYGYGAVTSAAAMGDPMSVARAIEASGWDAGRYGSGGGMYPGSISKMIGGDFGGGTVNHYLEVAVKQPDGSTDKYKVNLTSPYRNVVTSSNWGVSSIF